MPTQGEVRSTVTDLVVQLTGTPSGDVTPDAALADLGIDSLLMVELADELGRRHDVYLSDQTVDGLVTIDDAVAAVTSHDGTKMPRWARRRRTPMVTPAAAAAAAPPLDVEGVHPQSAVTIHDEPFDREQMAADAIGTGVVMVILGAIVGVALGFALAAGLKSAGLGESDLPPIAAPTTAVTTEPSPEPTTATATPEPDEPAVPEPTLTASSDTVPPGQRFSLTGALPAAGPGVELRVQVKDPAGAWDDFPVTLTTGENGSFTAEVYTSRTGKREWRLVQSGTDLATPSVAVTIG